MDFWARLSYWEHAYQGTGFRFAWFSNATTGLRIIYYRGALGLLHMPIQVNEHTYQRLLQLGVITEEENA
jgi:hypothetical protein